jgi:hypothetical protein
MWNDSGNNSVSRVHVKVDHVLYFAGHKLRNETCAHYNDRSPQKFIEVYVFIGLIYIYIKKVMRSLHTPRIGLGGRGDTASNHS